MAFFLPKKEKPGTPPGLYDSLCLLTHKSGRLVCRPFRAAADNQTIRPSGEPRLDYRRSDVTSLLTLPRKASATESGRIFFQLVHGGVGIDLGRGDATVPGYFLNAGHRCPGSCQSGQTRMPERVRRSPKIQIRRFAVSLDQFLHGPDGQRPMLSVLE